ncbi:MAG: dTDP-4-dehydrorhamnose 3,5-epimerase, partial [Pedobacter sp.]
KVDQMYSKDHERGVLWSDSSIGLKWPLGDVVISGKDSELPTLSNAEVFD